MNTKLINHEKYWLLVDTNIEIGSDGSWIDKAIAHLPKDNAPILEGVALLPELPNQGEILALAHSNKFVLTPAERRSRYNSFLIGYEAASKNKWSEELLKKIAQWKQKTEDGRVPIDNMDVDDAITNSIAEGAMVAFRAVEKYLQSLSPVTLPIDFKPEYENEYEGDSGYFGSDAIVGKHLKTVKNEAAIEVLQGEWIYQ